MNETTMVMDEGSAVVDDQGASVLAGSEAGRAFTGDIDRRAVEATQVAAMQFENYFQIDADGRFVPQLELTVESWAKQMAAAQFGEEASDADVLDLVFTIQRALAAANTKNSASLLDRVSVDIMSDIPGRPQDLLHPTAPMVVYMAVKRGSFLWRDGACRAIAVCYVPNQRTFYGDLANEPLSGIQREDGGYDVAQPYNGRMYADTRWLDGYLGVLEYFPSLRLAQEAADQLRQAVKVLATPAPTARTRDFSDELNDEYEAMDADEARRQRTGQQQRRQQQFAARRQSPV